MNQLQEGIEMNQAIRPSQVAPSIDEFPRNSNQWLLPEQLGPQNQNEAQNLQRRNRQFQRNEGVPVGPNSNREQSFSLQNDSNIHQNIWELIPPYIYMQIQNQKLRDPKYLKFKQIIFNNKLVKEYYEGLIYLNEKFGFGTSFKIIKNQEGFFSLEYYEGEFALNFYHGFGCLIKFSSLGEQSEFSGKFFKGEKRNDYFIEIDEHKKKRLLDLEPKKYNKKNQIEKLYYGPTSDDIRSGLGLYVFPGKYDYLGYFQNDRFHGRGRITFANGNTYQGEWKYGYMGGFGEYEWNVTYEINFQELKKIIVKEKFIGFYEEGKKQKGIYEWSDKVKYYGEFKNDLMDGDALLQQEYGQVKKTKWENGKKVSDKPDEEEVYEGLANQQLPFMSRLAIQ